MAQAAIDDELTAQPDVVHVVVWVFQHQILKEAVAELQGVHH